MDKNNALLVVISILVGVGIGYFLFAGSRGVNQNDQAMNMHGMMMSMGNDMQEMMGEDFDKSFLDNMIVHHEGAVMMAQMVLAKSERPELRNLANEIIDAQTREIEMMKGWRNGWFGQ